MKMYKVFKKIMYSKDRGLALLDITEPHRWFIKKTGNFTQNAILINSEGNKIKTVYLKPMTEYKSYVVNIDVNGNEIFLVDFRGYAYQFDILDETATYKKCYEKY